MAPPPSHPRHPTAAPPPPARRPTGSVELRRLPSTNMGTNKLIAARLVIPSASTYTAPRARSIGRPRVMPTAPIGRVHRVTAWISVTAVLFCLFFEVNKGGPFRDVNPFGVDPYDAVGSFAIQIALLVGALTYARALRPLARPARPPLALCLRAGPAGGCGPGAGPVAGGCSAQPGGRLARDDDLHRWRVGRHAAGVCATGRLAGIASGLGSVRCVGRSAMRGAKRASNSQPHRCGLATPRQDAARHARA